MDAWGMWKKGFQSWEQATANAMDVVLQSPLVLRPAGEMLTRVMKAKIASDEATARWWTAWGLPTRREQERMMHAMNQLQSRLHDLEERLADAES